MITNKLGELLKEMRNPNLSQSRLDEIVTYFNELGEREEKYKSWLQAQGNKPQFAGFANTVGPDWQQSPLHAYTFSQLTDLATTNNTDTYVTFDFSSGESKFFALDPADMTRLKILRGGTAWHIDGYTNWEANAAGYRKLHIEGFNGSDVSLGNTPVYTLPGSSLVDNVTPINYTSSWLQFANLAYLKFFVRQTSGGSLLLKDLVLNIHVV